MEVALEVEVTAGLLVSAACEGIVEELAKAVETTKTDRRTPDLRIEFRTLDLSFLCLTEI
jgi:hypothetical protein